MKGPRRVVVKIGTNTLTGKDGFLDRALIAEFAREIVAIKSEGREIIVVSSGAIGAGRAVLGFKEKVRDVKLRQACAAVGQPRLMRAWEEAFEPHGVPVAQLLLTYHTFASRSSFLHLKNATEALLDLGAVPIVNENDTVSIEEIDASFGDNDRLSALVASKVQADLLVILSDVSGLFTKPPGVAGAELLADVEAITPHILKMAGAKAGASGRGGMKSKLESARLCTRAGIPVVIASGREPQALTRVVAGESVGTRFHAEGRERGKARWLAIARATGRIIVDAGAARAIEGGKHLLPAGVLAVDGRFATGDVVEILHERRVVAKAVAALSSAELERVKGLRTEAAKKVLSRSAPVNVTKKKNVALVKSA